jgi:hypothetical protein
MVRIATRPSVSRRMVLSIGALREVDFGSGRGPTNRRPGTRRG